MKSLYWVAVVALLLVLGIYDEPLSTFDAVAAGGDVINNADEDGEYMGSLGRIIYMFKMARLFRRTVIFFTTKKRRRK